MAVWSQKIVDVWSRGWVETHEIHVCLGGTLETILFVVCWSSRTISKKLRGESERSPLSGINSMYRIPQAYEQCLLL